MSTTTHDAPSAGSYYVPHSSPWPIIGSVGLFVTMMGGANLLNGHAPTLLLPLVLVPAAWRLQRELAHGPRGLALNGVLFRTFRMELHFAALLAAGAVLGRVLS